MMCEVDGLRGSATCRRIEKLGQWRGDEGEDYDDDGARNMTTTVLTSFTHGIF